MYLKCVIYILTVSNAPLLFLPLCWGTANSGEFVAVSVERHSVLFSKNYQIEEKTTDFLEIFFQKYMNNFTEFF